jgi:hypothetical protein
MVANPPASRNDQVAETFSVADLVRALGGPAAVGRWLGITSDAVSMWYVRRRGPPAIPPQHHPALWRLAQAKGVAWTPPGFEGLRLVPVVDPHSDDASVTSAQVVRENPVKLDDAA